MENLIITNHSDLELLIQNSLKKFFKDNPQPTNSSKNSDKFLSVDEAADFLNLSKQTLYGFTSNRIVPFLKRGKRLYFSKADLEKWLLDGRKKTVQEI